MNTDNSLQQQCSENVSAYISVDEMAKMLSIARATAYQLTKNKTSVISALPLRSCSSLLWEARDLLKRPRYPIK